MLFEIIIALLLGVLFYVLVWQHGSKPTKSFKVTDVKRTKTILLKYTSFESFSEKCRAMLNFGKNEKLQFSSCEDENIALDGECIEDLEDKSLLIVKGETDASVPNDDDDDDAWTDIELVGSDSFECDTVVDNADMEKWEYLQQGDVNYRIVMHGLRNIKGKRWLNIAVTGESGKGKSSFINAFRSVSPGQKGAAKVNEEECTRYCRPFRHPKYDSFTLWDVPGVGTINFPKQKYLNAINADRYDFFMIVSSTRFSELDFWLAKEILMMKKKFYFVRTKIDIDMSNKKRRLRRLGQHFCETVEFDKMKSEIWRKLYYDFQIEKLHFFMISNHHPNKYDSPLILNQLLQDVSNYKAICLDSQECRNTSSNLWHQH